MPQLNFPDNQNPQPGDTYTGPNGITYTYDGVRWNGNVSLPPGPRGFTGSQGTQGFTGSLGFTGSQGVGFAGSRGFTGSEGTKGFTGSIGFSGKIGRAHV